MENFRDQLALATGISIDIVDPVNFQNSVRFTELPEQQISTAQAAATTISVLNTTRVRLTNTGAVSVTNLLFGQEGQQVLFLGDGFTTFVHGTNIFTNSGANKLLAANKVYTFTKFSTGWIENA